MQRHYPTLSPRRPQCSLCRMESSENQPLTSWRYYLHFQQILHLQVHIHRFGIRLEIVYHRWWWRKWVKQSSIRFWLSNFVSFETKFHLVRVWQDILAVLVGVNKNNSYETIHIKQVNCKLWRYELFSWNSKFKSFDQV